MVEPPFRGIEGVGGRRRKSEDSPPDRPCGSADVE